jgi:aldose 1-epimerase
MVPYAGRIPHGKFTYEGVEHTLPIGLAPHAIHGTGYTAAWEELEDGSIEHWFPPAWPFGGRAIQRFDLDDDSFTCTIEIHAERTMPVSAGWHPWWVKPIELGFHAQVMYERDEEDIPTGRLIAPPPGPWDDIFTGVASMPTLHWPDGPSIVIESDCDHWVVFDKPDHAMCVEPQSGPANALNMAPRLVHPGTPFVTWMRLVWG